MNWLVGVMTQTRVCGPRSWVAPKRQEYSISRLMT
jgi:hypothetical protein